MSSGNPFVPWPCSSGGTQHQLHLQQHHHHVHISHLHHRRGRPGGPRTRLHAPPFPASLQPPDRQQHLVSLSSNNGSSSGNGASSNSNSSSISRVPVPAQQQSGQQAGPSDISSYPGEQHDPSSSYSSSCDEPAVAVGTNGTGPVGAAAAAAAAVTPPSEAYTTAETPSAGPSPIPSPAAKAKSTAAKFANRLIFGVLLGVVGGGTIAAGTLPFLAAILFVAFQATQEYYGFITSRQMTEGMTPPPPLVSSLTTVLCVSMAVLAYFKPTSLRSGSVLALASFILLVLEVLLIKKPKFAQMASSLFGLFYCGRWKTYWKWEQLHA
eukprot:scaffold135947_cov18-Tisochrysis_lutea.AAC.4